MLVRHTLAALVLFPAALFAEPVIRFDPYAVVAEGITPGGEAVWLSVSREAGEWSETLIPFHEVTLDEDGDGRVELVREKEFVATESVWIVADLATGAASVAVSDDYEKPEGEDPLWDEIDLRIFFDVRESLEVIVVRPKVGAWHGTVVDGAKTDADGLDDGLITILASALEPIGKTEERLIELLPGDVLLGIDRHSLASYAVPVALEAGR